jgi:hypothetical protein
MRMLCCLLTISLALDGCKHSPASESEHTQPASGTTSNSGDGSNQDPFDMKLHPEATIVHPIDPHTLSESQLKFGIAPRRDPNVEYQPDIILMEDGDKAIRSIASDGLTWTFDANSPHVSEFQEGKIVFATSRAVGRVLGLKRQGDNVSVILGPIQITDVIRNGSFAMSQPIDVNNMISYVAPDYPQPADDSPGATTSFNRKAPSNHVDERIIVSQVSRDGKWSPTSMVNSYADGRRVSFRKHGPNWSGSLLQSAQFSRSKGSGGFVFPALRKASYEGLQMPGVPGVGGIHAPQIPPADLPPAPTMGPVPVVDLQGVTAKAIAGSSGIGVQYLYNKNGLNLNAYGLMSIQNAGIDFFLHIKDAKIQDCGVRMKGAVGLKLHLNSSSTQEFKVNFHKRLTLPVDLTIPLGASGVPLEMTFNQAFTVDTAFSAKTSVLNAEGDYTFSGGINAGYWLGSWRVTTPTDVSAKTDIGNTAEGISVGINSLVMGFSLRTMIGIGAFGFSSGVYAGLRFAGTVLRSPDIGYPCRQGTIEAFIDSGVGYSIPGWVTDALNLFISPFTSHKIDRSGTLMRGPTLRLFHGDTQIPSKCSTPKEGAG